MATTNSLPCPIKVSGCIKLFRWTFLLCGIYYGFSRQARLARNEVAIRAEELRLKLIRDAKIAKERQIQSDKDIAMLASLADPVEKGHRR